GYTKRMYPWSDLQDKSVTGYGYGLTSLTTTPDYLLHSGVMKVANANLPFSGNPGIRLVANPNQIVFEGDSGGPVMLATNMGEALAAVSTSVDPGNGVPAGAQAIPTAAISQWVIKSMFPNKYFWCHGVECMTTAAMIPNNTTLGYTTSWNPCG